MRANGIAALPSTPSLKTSRKRPLPASSSKGLEAKVKMTVIAGKLPELCTCLYSFSSFSIAIVPPFAGLRRFPKAEALSSGRVIIRKPVI